jgi:chemotaxis protein methyltransferase CheR
LQTLIRKISDIIESQTGINIKNLPNLEYLISYLEKVIKEKNTNPASFYEYLNSNDNSAKKYWDTIYDILNISESYFFRDEGQFKLLEQKILPDLIESKNQKGTILIWSAGCSNGQEAYSIAIVLDKLQKEFENVKFSILATDINRNSIQNAQNGIYQEWSFRKVNPSIIEKYFIKRNDSLFEIKPEIKSRVQFRHLNLLEDSYPREVDLIICRNVFIYMKQDTVSKIISKFADSLSMGGCLLTGHAEYYSNLPSSLKSELYSGYLVYKKTKSSIPNSSLESKKPSSSLSFESKKNTDFNLTKTTSPETNFTIEDALGLIESREFQKARSILEKIIEKTSIEYLPYFHIAKLYELEGKTDKAMDCYKKVLYLKPEFLECYQSLLVLYENLNQKLEAKKIIKQALFQIDFMEDSASHPKNYIEKYKKIFLDKL